MDTLTSIKLVELRQHDLRVDVAHARLASPTRQARRRRSRIDRHPRARLWRRTPTETSKPVAVAPTAQSIRFDHLASKLASDGPAATHDELTRFVKHAAARGATPLLLSILADDDQPDVARQRAFGRIAVELASAVAGTAHPVSGRLDAA